MELVSKLRSIPWSRNFTLFAVASFISGAGNALIPIAFSVESLRVDSSGVGIAFVMLALWIGRFIGMLGYRKATPYNLKVTMIYADSVRLCAQVGLLIYILHSPNSILAMALSALLYGIASSYFLPANFQLIPKITDEKYREEANSVLSILGDIYSIVGPLTGASLIIFLGFEAVLLIDSISFLVAILLISLIKISPPASKPESSSSRKGQEQHPKLTLNFPSWALNGLKSWFFVSVAIGFLGVAAPAIVIQNHSEGSWAFIATSIAVGSLLGSVSTLGGFLKNKRWQAVHCCCLVLLPAQLVAVSSNIPTVLIAFCALLGALATTASGIKWDTITQNGLNERELSCFASADQMVTNTAIPLGMMLFGLASYLSLTGYFIGAIVICVFGSVWFIRASIGNNTELIHD